MVKQAGLTERTFKRRFTQATGLSPIAYVQRLRIEEAKRRLERTEASVDEISWQVGYEESAFFRRLFKRVTGLSPGVYRRRFQVPGFARAGDAIARAEASKISKERSEIFAFARSRLDVYLQRDKQDRDASNGTWPLYLC